MASIRLKGRLDLSRMQSASARRSYIDPRVIERFRENEMRLKLANSGNMKERGGTLRDRGLPLDSS